ncbi:MAG: ATP-dependent protease La domain-containing protein [Bryobacterales bacterium]|nr:ATP-dependent protease La domain-containing protein [Bryobacterales bacterium]
MQAWLPLFPLQVVLLPDAELPLHIFEERYKEMIGEILRDNIEFGVVLASDQGLAGTGCTGVIDRVLRQYPDGRLDILTKGRRRFEIMSLNEDRPFLRGEVEYFDDEEVAGHAESPGGDDFRVRAIAGYNELRALSAEAPLPMDDIYHPQLSFRLARPVQDLSLRQALLSSRSETERLRKLADFLPAFLVRQRRIERVKQVAPRNGHGGKVAGVP